MDFWDVDMVDELGEFEEMSDEYKERYVGEEKWRNTEENIDEHDQASSLPFRKIYFRYSPHVEPRNLYRARIVAEEWFAQLPPSW